MAAKRSSDAADMAGQHPVTFHHMIALMYQHFCSKQIEHIYMRFKLETVVMHFRMVTLKPIMLKKAQSHTLETAIGVLLYVDFLCPSSIRRDRTYVRGSTSEIIIPPKLRGRDGSWDQIGYRNGPCFSMTVFQKFFNGLCWNIRTEFALRFYFFCPRRSHDFMYHGC